MQLHRTWITALAAAAALAGCNSDDSNQPADGSGDDADVVVATLGFGETCGVDGECLSNACFETRCTRPCGYLADCPEAGHTCGDVGGGRLLCVTTRYETGAGRVGASCVSEACDTAGGYRCVRTVPDDPLAYCTHVCADDRDCPSDMACRETNDGRACVPRGYCEPCVVDDQCGYANDDCIADDAGNRFCSVLCDPARPTTCPQDAVCVEARPGRFQCKPAFGRCVGDGGYCEPCRRNAECTTGGTCITDTYSKFSFCGRPCDAGEDYPVEHYCNSDLGQCRPRKGSCVQPSGGRHTCEACSDFTDCYNGWCLDYMPVDGRGETCGDLCDPGDPDSCGPWGTCTELTSGTTTVGYACLPNGGMRCMNYLTCVGDCPDGPTGCSHAFCI